MDNVVSINHTKPNTLEFDLSIEGVETKDMTVRMVIFASGMHLVFDAKKKKGNTWAVELPELPLLKKTAYDMVIEVITDGYFFTPLKGKVNVVGSAEIYSTKPKNITLDPAEKVEEKSEEKSDDKPAKRAKKVEVEKDDKKVEEKKPEPKKTDSKKVDDKKSEEKAEEKAEEKKTEESKKDETPAVKTKEEKIKELLKTTIASTKQKKSKFSVGEPVKKVAEEISVEDIARKLMNNHKDEISIQVPPEEKIDNEKDSKVAAILEGIAAPSEPAIRYSNLFKKKS